jgi:hypothetical protein
MADPASKLDPKLAKEINDRLGSIRFGSIEIVVHQGKVVQLEIHEKLRFDPPFLRDGEGI